MTSYNKRFCKTIFFNNILKDVKNFVNMESEQNGLYSITQKIPVNYEIKMGDLDKNIVWDFIDTFLDKIGIKTKILNTQQFFTYYRDQITLLNSLPYNDPLVNQIQSELNKKKYNMKITSFELDEYVRFMFRFFNMILYNGKITQLSSYILNTLSSKYNKNFNDSCITTIYIYNDSDEMSFIAGNSNKKESLDYNNLNNYIKNYIKPLIQNCKPVIIIPIYITVEGKGTHSTMMIIENRDNSITIHHYEPHGSENGFFYLYSGSFLEDFTTLIGSVTKINTDLNIASSFNGIQYIFDDLDIGFCEQVTYFWLYVSVLAIYTNKSKNKSISNKYFSKIEECLINTLSKSELYELVIRFSYNLIMNFFMDNQNNIDSDSVFKDKLSEYLKFILSDPEGIDTTVSIIYDNINSYELYQKLGGPSIINNKSSSGRSAKSYIPQYSRIKQTRRTRSMSPLKINTNSRSRSYNRDLTKSSDFKSSNRSNVPFSFSKLKSRRRKSSKLKSRRRKSSKLKSRRRKSSKRKSIIRKSSKRKSSKRKSSKRKSSKRKSRRRISILGK